MKTATRSLVSLGLVLGVVACGGETSLGNHGNPVAGGGQGGGLVAGSGGTSAGGSSNSGGGPVGPTAGSAGATLNSRPPVDKIDLLFMIDNSASMADKQAILAAGVSQIVGRFVTPACLDASGAPQGASVGGVCPAGQTIEITPVTDIHIGVVTSSLGTNGADECGPSGPKFTPDQNDGGHLISRALGGSSQVDTYGANLGFLAWDPTSAESPAGESNAATLEQNFTSIVTGANQDGCGFEAQLEGWYRFLVEPSPPTSVTAPAGAQLGTAPTVSNDLDTALLAQRAEFLRPDSLLGIVMLTDENDCSIAAVPLATSGQTATGTQTFDQIDRALPASALPWRLDRNASPALGGFPPNYITAQIYEGSTSQQFHMTSGTAACTTNPDSPDCQSCLIPQYATDPGCTTLDAGRAASDNTSPDDDNDNLRCWNQKQRFGVETLYPLRRYVDGITQSSVYDFFTGYLQNTPAPLVENPLFQDLPFRYAQALKAAGTDPATTPFAAVTRTSPLPPRAKNLVFLAGIVGVPWQDIYQVDPATGAPSVALGYRSTDPAVTDPNKQIDWDLIVGQIYSKPQQPGAPAAVPPTDPFMIEAIRARTGVHPITGDDVGAADNKINGHEWSPIPQGSDLEYACIFDLPGPTMGDCDASSSSTKSPLCEGGTIGAGDGNYGSTQTRAKAFPGLRELAVLRAVHDEGGSAIPASICAPNVTGSPTAPTYGYNFVVDPLVARVKP